MSPQVLENFEGKRVGDSSRDDELVREQLLALQRAFESHLPPQQPANELTEVFLYAHVPQLHFRSAGVRRAAYVKDYGGRYLYASDAWSRLCGAGWFGRVDRDLWPSTTAADLRAIDARVLNDACISQAVVTLPSVKWLITEFPIRMGGAGDDFIGGVAVALDAAPSATPEAHGHSGEKCHDILDGIPTGVYRIDVHGRLLFANAALLRMLGCTTVDDVAAGCDVGPARPEEFASLIEGNGELRGFEAVWVRRDGAKLRARQTARAVKDASGRTAYYEGTVEDMESPCSLDLQASERNTILEAIASDTGLQVIFDQIVKTAERHLSGALCAISVAHENDLEIQASGSLPRGFIESVQHLDIRHTGGNGPLVLKLGEPLVTGDIELHPCWAGLRKIAVHEGLRSCTSVPLLASDRSVLGTLDVYRRHQYAPDAAELEFTESLARLAAIAAERHRRIERLDEAATVDPLTRLPNRAVFESNLAKAIARAGQTGSALAVLWVDLDRLTAVNDNLGHHAGDELLKSVAARMVETFPDAYLCRSGGDEFAILLTQIGTSANAHDAANRLLSAFRQPFEIEGQHVVVTCSVGLSVFPEDGNSATALLRNADAAMYRAKAWGKNTVERHQNSLNLSGRRLELENQLRTACAQNELELFYQPQADMNGHVDGMEALLRWRHPTLGLLPPSEFLSIAEETGMIIDPIGEWVLRQASRQFVKWNAALPAGMRIAVNVSASQIYRTDLPRLVARILNETGMQPENMEIELTESVLMHNLDESVRKVQALRALGVSIAIDDFGTGYSSLSYLRQLPVDTLKIDKSFLGDIESRTGAALVRAITTLAKELGLRLIAEGVETQDQMTLLRRIGIEHVQGYLISKPVPAPQAAVLLN